MIHAYFRSLAARFFRRSQTEHDLEEELRSHIQLRADDLERFGLGRAEAERRARIEFGGPERFKEECREAIAGNFIDILFQDLRFGLRMFRKSPGFAAVVILTVALGIGATPAIFSVVDATLLRPLPYSQPEQLVSIQADLPGLGARDVGISQPEWRTFRIAEFSNMLRRLGSTKIISPVHPNLREYDCLSSRRITSRCWACYHNWAALSIRTITHLG